MKTHVETLDLQLSSVTGTIRKRYSCKDRLIPGNSDGHLNYPASCRHDPNNKYGHWEDICYFGGLPVTPQFVAMK